MSRYQFSTFKNVCSRMFEVLWSKIWIFWKPFWACNKYTSLNNYFIRNWEIIYIEKVLCFSAFMVYYILLDNFKEFSIMIHSLGSSYFPLQIPKKHRKICKMCNIFGFSNFCSFKVLFCWNGTFQTIKFDYFKIYKNMSLIQNRKTPKL